MKSIKVTPKQSKYKTREHQLEILSNANTAIHELLDMTMAMLRQQDKDKKETKSN